MTNHISTHLHLQVLAAYNEVSFHMSRITRTHHRVFKDLPQVAVVVGGVVVGRGDEPPELMTVCDVHEDSLQQTGKHIQVSFMDGEWKLK